jgi:glycosyltransferase involved in cell wall biosynthesis
MRASRDHTTRGSGGDPPVHSPSASVTRRSTHAALRIAIDARSAIPQSRTGIGYYTWHLVDLLPRIDPETTYIAWYLDVRGALAFRNRRRLFDHVDLPNLVDRRTPIPARWFERLSSRFDVPRLEWLFRFDVLFAPNFIPPPTRTQTLVLTVHDLAYKLFPQTAPLATRAWLSRLDAALARASRVIVVSEQSRHDLLNTYRVDPERVFVVPLGVDTDLFKPAPPQAIDSVRRRYGIEGPYLVSLGALEPRKNLPATIRAFASLPEDVRPALVLVGAASPWNREGWDLVRSALEELPIPVRKRVVLTGYVPEAEKVALLSGAEALVYPSLYEGFGLPVIEAMACGTPVLTSNTSALPETAGSAALLVDPDDVEAIADGLQRLLTDRSLRRALRDAGTARASAFTWEATARQTADILREAKA